jgi:hypothetical protein
MKNPHFRPGSGWREDNMEAGGLPAYPAAYLAVYPAAYPGNNFTGSK